MASMRSLRFWQFQILAFLSVLPFLVTGQDALTSSSSDLDIDHLLTGHVQISTNSVPNEVLPCLTEPSLTATTECPFKYSQWNNMHCLNNSFGMYADGNRFVNFGGEPLGIVFPSLFFNPIVSYSGFASGPSDSDEQTKKIEALLEENAEAIMNVTLLGEMLEKLQHEKKELEEELYHVKLLNQEQRGQLHVYQLKAERWEEVHEECSASSELQRNTSSIALKAAQAHIAQLKIDNQIFMEASLQCSSNLATLQETLANVRNESHENMIKLAQCTTSLSASRQSEEFVRNALAVEEERHLTHIEEYKQERDVLITARHDAMVALATCEASRIHVQDILVETKEKYHTCLENVGQTNAQLDLCRSALSLCRSNHSAAELIGNACDQEHKLCLNEVSYLKKSLATCENNTNVLNINLREAKANEHRLTEQITSIRADLEACRHSEAHLTSNVNNLRTELQQANNALSDADAQARECALDLVTASTSLNIAHTQAEELSTKLEELREKYSTLSQKNFITVTDLLTLSEKYKILLADSEKCHHMLNDATASSQRLIQGEANCHKQLTNVTLTLAVIESQRDACYGSHSTSLEEVDEWRVRYQDISVQLTTCHIEHVNCSSRLNMLTNLYNALDEEVDQVEALNVNLKDRLNMTLESLASMTSISNKLREDLTIQKQEMNALEKRFIDSEASLEAEKHSHEECQNKLEQSNVRAATLESKISELASASRALQNSLDLCSQHLNETHTSLQAQRGVTAEQERDLQALNSELEVVKSEYHGAQVQVESLTHQLELCRSNHTESVGEAMALEIQLMHCQQNLTEVQTSSLRQVQQVEGQLMDCQHDLRHASETLNETILTSQGLQIQVTSQAEQIATITRSYQVSLSTISTYVSRLNTLKDLIHKLQSEIQTLKSRVETTNVQLESTRELLTHCRETKDKQELQLFDLTEQLQQCRTSGSSSWPTGCPQASQGTYVSSAYGCLLVTQSSGSQHEMAALCTQQSGRLLTREAAVEPRFHEEVSRLVTTGHLPASTVWLSSGDTTCYDLHLDQSASLSVLHSRPCIDRLPGLCVTEHELSYQTQFDESTFLISNSSYSVSSSSGFDFSTFNLQI